jgi:hypothetical protein
MRHAYRHPETIFESRRYRAAAPPAPGAAHPAAKQPAAPPPAAPWPFPVGTLSTENASDYDQTLTMTAASQRFPDVKVEPDGWCRGLWFDFNLVTAANAATVAFTEDGPLALISTVLFRDTGGEQIFGPFGMYDWAMSNKYGAYQATGDPRGDVNFVATAGAGSTGGSVHVSLYLPLEISAADALGAVENRSENSIYRVELTMAPSASVYTTPPTTLGALEIKTTQDSFTEPVAAMNLSGRPVSSAPPSPGTLQYWKQEEDTGITAGTHASLITNGIGNGYRNILFILRRAGTSRANGQLDWPDPQQITLGTTRTRNLYKKTWADKMGRAFDYAVATADAAHGPENGVFLLWFTQDVGISPGDEARRKYQRTKTGNTYKVRGTYGNAGTLWINSNYVVPRNNDFSQVVA